MKPPQPPRQTYSELDATPGSLYYPHDESIFLVAPMKQSQPTIPNKSTNHIPGAVAIPSWLEAWWPLIKLSLSTKCPAAASQEFVNQLTHMLITAHPTTLAQAMQLVDKSCAGLGAPVATPRPQPQIHPRSVTGSIDLTANDRDPGLGYGHFYAPVNNYWYSTLPILRPWPAGIIPPGQGLTSSDS